MRIESLHHTAVSVRDFQRSIPFYEEILGLERDERPDFGLEGAWYRIGDVQLHIIQTPEGLDVGTKPEKLTPVAAHVAVRVDDFEGAKAHFAGHGVDTFELGPEGDQFWVQDPDGNIFEFTRV
jgi:glyoxylase I family protein